MEDGKWTSEDFIGLARQRLAVGQESPAAFGKAMQQLLAEVVSQYEDCTPDGKAYIERLVNGFTDILDSNLQKAEDSAEVRVLKRTVSASKGKHFFAKDLIEVFEEMPGKSDPWMTKGLEVFTRTLQTLLDIMHDVTRVKGTGASSLSRIGLFYWLVDELIAAQSLARRHHSTMSYTHLRCTMEILDKVELFGEKPEFAELWMSGDEHAIWKKLSPARVREQLSREAFDPGKKSYDPLYEYLSEQGSHSTFTALKARFRAQKRTEDSDLNIAFIVGGAHLPGREISIIMYCILLMNMAIMKAFVAFEPLLNLEDVSNLVVGASDETFGFFNEFMGSLDGSSYDKQPFELLLAGWENMLDSSPFKQDSEQQP